VATTDGIVGTLARPRTNLHTAAWSETGSWCVGRKQDMRRCSWGWGLWLPVGEASRAPWLVQGQVVRGEGTVNGHRAEG
jgi:hypothetical protein